MIVLLFEDDVPEFIEFWMCEMDYKSEKEWC